MVDIKRFARRAFAPLALLAALPAQAATLSLNYDLVFSDGAVAPDGPAPYMTAVFDDGGSSGSVTLTMTIAGTVGDATVEEVYFNFDPSLDLGQLNFAFNSGTGPDALGGGANNGIFVGTDAFQADGDGKYDIRFDFPPPTGNNKWEAGEFVVYDITSAEAITANSFAFLSAPGGGAAGPLLSAAHFMSTGPSGNDSAWVGAVPIPAAVWLFGSGLLGLAGMAARRRTG